MNYLEKLLEGIEVNWKPLAEIANFSNGKGHENAISEEGEYIVVNSKFISTNGRVAKYCNVQICPLYIDDILIVMSDLPNGKALAKTFIVKEDDKYTLNQRIGAISVKDKDALLPKFLSYFLNRTPHLTKYNNGVDQTNLKKGEILDVEIPIPCPNNKEKSLEIQAKIIRSLDFLTDLTNELITELTTEITTRRKQYNYYRNQLLSFEDDDVEWKTLGEVAAYSRTRISSEHIDSTNYVGVDNLLQNKAGKTESNYVPTEGNLTEYRTGDVLIGNIRPYLKKIWHADRTGGASGDVLVIHPTDETLNPRYLYQILSDEKFFEYSMQHAKGAKMPRGNKDKIMEYSFPIPKRQSEQERIAFILDKFDVLTNSINDGLPREIALRQQQYEYYRDLLLSFPKQEKESA
nr:restriction endonuclease subunit S [uncultured Deefgea sp.]